MKKIAFMIAFTVVMAILIQLFLSVATFSLPTVTDLVSMGIACIIIDVYALCTGWHNKLWACIIEDRPVEDDEDDEF